MANPIDAFILHELEKDGLRANEPAGKLTLLRRVTFDLTGLPPTPDEQHLFLSDDSPGAYLRVVDRLLASPAFGERWARHWLDVVRFAETEGFKSDRLRPNAYRYRDYVIRSFNDDRPYRDFVRQQLAGDQLQPGDPEALIATGMNRLYTDEDNAANLFQRRQEILNDITETAGLAFMGLTMGCARCHDHKFDDILQADFYALQAFFAPMIERDDIPAAAPEEIASFERQQVGWAEATAEIRAEMNELLVEQRKKTNNYDLTKFRPEIQACYLKSSTERTPLEEQIARMVAKQLDWRFDESKAAEKLEDAQRIRYEELERQLDQFAHQKPTPLPLAMAVSDVGNRTPPTHRLDGGNWKKPLEEVQPGFPQFLGGNGDFVSDETPTSDSRTTGRRAKLAYWLTQDDHPLTARVIVNRVWQHHFGRGIVDTPNDFGVMGEAPTHRELLDWLAVELTTHDWSLKHIHRLMVTSATYRQSSAVSAKNPTHARAREVDPDNNLLWHARSRRLDAESIRDAMLSVSCQLNNSLYGPGVHPPLPDGVSPRYAWKPDASRANHFRRSIYVVAKRNMRLPLFDVFDWPDMHASCARRTTTTTASQALLMLNSGLTQQLARAWAERLRRQYGADIAGLVDDAYRSAFGRPAASEEIEVSRQFLVSQTQLIEGSGSSVRQSSIDSAERTLSISDESIVDFCHALLNSNEFIHLD